MTAQSMQTVTIDVEQELLKTIIQNLEQNNLDIDQAKKLAQNFLSLLPLQDQKDLLEKLYKLSKEHNQTNGLYLKYAKPYEENERQKKLTLMSEHIKNGQIEHALAIAKGDAPNGS
ncbi:MAG TPA: hypothetical protein VNW29_01190 [Candidatus Sulfotelmatobacter sp.]|jgi:hypothetical protein|nr:hypothetical protein [Candidatus Sulfotelmatobacter sp.]